MISKELLSEVLGVDVTTHIHIDDGEYDGNPLGYKTIWFNYQTYPLCVVAHKCKEWAFKQNFIIVTLPYISEKWSWILHGDEISDDIDYNTEPEAIFKACQWILDNKGKYEETKRERKQ